jgi:acyltransferase
MPLFFLISGYVFDSSKYRTLKLLVRKRIRTLIIPYFVFAFLSYLFWLLIVRQLSITGESLKTPALKPLVGIFYSIGVNGWNIPLDTALWFLTCLFVVEILFWCILKLSNGRLIVALVLLAFSFLGYCDSVLIPYRLPWSIEVAFTAVVFYGMGYLFRHQLDRLTDFASTKMLYLLPVIVVSTCFCFLNTRVDMNGNYYGNPIFFYVSAFAGIVICIVLSKKLPRVQLMNYIGNNTIVVLGLSGVCLYVISGAIYLMLHYLLDLVHVSLLAGVILSLLQLILLLPVIYVINTFFPFVLGCPKKHGSQF